MIGKTAGFSPYNATLLLLLSACSLAPNYKKPDMEVPAEFKEAAGSWLPATPEAAEANKGAWWENYHDADLNALEAKIAGSNQDLKAALARYDEARAQAAYARADYYPTINGNVSAARTQISRTISEVRTLKPYNNYALGGDLSYELDLWGRVRNNVKANEKIADASEADLAAMDLSLHAELAMDYFSLRAQDNAQKMIDETVASYDQAYKLTKLRHDGGIAAEVDVDQAQTQLASAQTLAADTRLKRAQLEHAIAVLIGVSPSDFSIVETQTDTTLPPVNLAIPSQLLEARPDISAAALRVEAANAQIGVARAAYFPDFTISGNGGLESAFTNTLFNAPSLFWSLGPSAVVPLFDGGRIEALSAQAHAAYDETVANYRATVLNAFQEVEDSLAASHQLAEQNQTQTTAFEAAQRTVKQAKDRYSGGIATYLDVSFSQNTLLQTELSAIDVRTRRLNTSVMLIKALGGNGAGMIQQSPSIPATDDFKTNAVIPPAE